MNQASANSFIQQACLLNTQIGCVRTILRVKASRVQRVRGGGKRVARPLARTWNSSTSSGNPRNWNGPWLRHRTPAGVEPRMGPFATAYVLRLHPPVAPGEHEPDLLDGVDVPVGTE